MNPIFLTQVFSCFALLSHNLSCLSVFLKFRFYVTFGFQEWWSTWILNSNSKLQYIFMVSPPLSHLTPARSWRTNWFDLCVWMTSRHYWLFLFPLKGLHVYSHPSVTGVCFYHLASSHAHAYIKTVTDMPQVTMLCLWYCIWYSVSADGKVGGIHFRLCLAFSLFGYQMCFSNTSMWGGLLVHVVCVYGRQRGQTGYFSPHHSFTLKQQSKMGNTHSSFFAPLKWRSDNKHSLPGIFCQKQDVFCVL